MNNKGLKEKLIKYNINFIDEDIDKLISFEELLLQENKIHNLTSITDDDGVLYKHFIDSLLPEQIFKENSQIIDIGCGGGFPSIPLSIIRKDVEITAIDSTNKKINFVNNVKKDLNLVNLKPFCARVEDIGNNPKYREKFDYVVSRAVAPLNTIIEYSAPLLKDNGLIVAYKGSNYEEEIKLAKNALNLLNCSIKDIKKYTINEINSMRAVILIEKNGKIPLKYPRKQNKPRINPL